MKEDRLMDADEAKSLGFADEVTAPITMAAKFPLRLLPKAAAARLQALAGDDETEPPEPAAVPAAEPVPPALPASDPVPQPEPEPEQQPTAELINLNAAKKTGAAEHKAYVDSITDLCALARAPERVGAYVRAGTPVEQVRKELLARADEPSVMPQHPLLPPAQVAATAWSKITDKINARLRK
jgi:hypothetical protein